MPIILILVGLPPGRETRKMHTPPPPPSPNKRTFELGLMTENALCRIRQNDELHRKYKNLDLVFQVIQQTTMSLTCIKTPP